MAHSKYDQTLALGGIYQAVSLVRDIANKGSANNAHIESSLESLFTFDAASVEEVYGNVAGVSHGIKVLHAHLTDKTMRDIEINKYALSLTMLEKKLSRNPSMLEEISRQLKSIEAQFEFFSLMHDNTFTKLGQLYRDTISQLGPKIIVSGEQPYLSNPLNASKVRSLLLAGIRSAVLWRQCGGSRWQFIFGRSAYIEECEAIMGRL